MSDSESRDYFAELAHLARVVGRDRPSYAVHGSDWLAAADRFERFAMNIEAAILAVEAREVPADATPARIANARDLLETAKQLHGQLLLCRRLAVTRAASKSKVRA